jgi:hypothetical protein
MLVVAHSQAAIAGLCGQLIYEALTVLFWTNAAFDGFFTEIEENGDIIGK